MTECIPWHHSRPRPKTIGLGLPWAYLGVGPAAFLGLLSARLETCSVTTDSFRAQLAGVSVSGPCRIRALDGSLVRHRTMPLTPGRNLGTEPQANDGERFDAEMK